MPKPNMLPTRRRSASTGGGSTNGDTKKDGGTQNVEAGGAARTQRRAGRDLPTSGGSRPKRRSRGLPLSRPKQALSTQTLSDDDDFGSVSRSPTATSNGRDHGETADDAVSSSLGGGGKVTLKSTPKATPKATLKALSKATPRASPKLAGSRDSHHKIKNKNGDIADYGSDDSADDSSEEPETPLSSMKKRPRSETGAKSMHVSRPRTLVAVAADGKEYQIKLIANSQPFVHQSQSAVGKLSKKRGRSNEPLGKAKPDLESPKTGSAAKAGDDQSPAFLGNDGNLFYCHTCHGFGDVVCCDGCPHVYHPSCVPEGTSRRSLDNDDEPWYCPACLKTKKKTDQPGKKPSQTARSSSPLSPASSSSAQQPGIERRKVKRKCSECNLSTGPNPLKPCEGCGAYMHFPSCKQSDPESPSSTSGAVSCSVCRSEAALNQEEGEMLREKKKRKIQQRKESSKEGTEAGANGIDDGGTTRRKPRGLSIDEDMGDQSFVHDGLITLRTKSGKEGEGEKTPKKGSEIKKRKKSSTDAASPSGTSSKGEPHKKKKSDKKKKKKKKLAAAAAADSEEGKAEKEKDYDNLSNESLEADGAMASFHPLSPISGMAKATPAFYFFLGENRFKIERVLARKHRYFNRLPKGVERNELVAREGANWWLKLPSSETRRYMNMSMREFEQRVVEWKEEKNIREMLVDADIEETGLSSDDVEESSPDDELLTYMNHNRLYLGTTVGAKPFKPEPGESHNRVLLELLQDMRFHPVPMFSGNRSEAEYGQMDFSRITIPYFDVHGPVATSVGDECLGCARGWTHFCNVLRRRVPAVEHRARLQPPLSSLMATRVGLGLRPRPFTPKEEESAEHGKDLEIFSVREVPEATAAKNLPIVPWDSLSSPSSRADDIVQFIEEAVAMKVPEPPRPSPPGKSQQGETSKKSLLARGILPTRGKKRDSLTCVEISDSNKNAVVNKCGRCRTVIQTDTGCIQCRRAQLVINMSKRSSAPAASPGNKASPNAEDNTPRSLKVQTYMLGRVTMKEGSGEVQSDGDAAVANAILKQRWTPHAVLPPQTMLAPFPKPRRSRSYSEDSQDSSAMDGQSEDAIENLPSDDSPPPDEPICDDNSVDYGDEEVRSRHSPKRLRTNRTPVTQLDPSEDPGRQQLAERHKIEANELHKKTLSVACCGILLAMMRRDPLLLFASPVTAEGYSLIVKTPIDFGKIRSNVLLGKYATLGSFVSDARLLCTNALAYNPPGSIYWKTAKELYDVLAIMQKRASRWMSAIKDAHAFAWRRDPRNSIKANLHIKDKDNDDDNSVEQVSDPFDQLREEWHEAVEMLENSDWLRKCIAADFMRTKENETAYYGSLAVRRAAVAAEASLAPYPDTGGVYNTVSRRSHVEDENLRRLVDASVAEVMDPVELKDLPSWREEAIIRVMRRAQSRRLEGRIGSINGCARCDGVRVDQELKMAMKAETFRCGKGKRKGDEVARVAPSRIGLSTGLASQKTTERIKNQQPDWDAKKQSLDDDLTAVATVDVAVSVRGSRIHGWGLFADQHFKQGDIVAEYLGEYVSLAVTEAREKIYQEQRIQDYQFRLDDSLVIDATMRGGHGRYINHNCNPNCLAKTIPGDPPNQHLKRVLIIAQRDIEPMEELTYDYQFPLELDLDARIPCNCQSEHCRGFMNWDLPEKGSNNRVLRSQKRGANMRDRIRRLGRPLKSDK